MLLPAIAIIDIGKTNKKFFLLDEQYKIIFEESVQLPEAKDEDGFPCEDVHLLTDWVNDLLIKIAGLRDVLISAINFSTYGASFVHVNSEGKPIAPLYNYLKPFPEKFQRKFYNKYGGESVFSQTTASPVLGSLNSGLQLYRLKFEQPVLFEKIRTSLHLPQYISRLVTGKSYSDITSIGCHTGLWDFKYNHYHQWLYQEGVIEKLPGIFNSYEIVKAELNNKKLSAGVGLHDSSAALIPYFNCSPEPFILLSTGTWCISFNPFNSSPLTEEEIQQDCLCYLTYHNQPVKASRVFAGYEHEQQIKRLAQHYHKHEDYYSTVIYNHEMVLNLRNKQPEYDYSKNLSVVKQSYFKQRDSAEYSTYEEAYHQLMIDLTCQQQASTAMILKSTEVKRIFVDGGFSKNSVYMHLIAAAFPGIEVYAASAAQASAIGAALAIHKHWNSKPLPGIVIDLKYYSLAQ